MFINNLFATLYIFVRILVVFRTTHSAPRLQPNIIKIFVLQYITYTKSSELLNLIKLKSYIRCHIITKECAKFSFITIQHFKALNKQYSLRSVIRTACSDVVSCRTQSTDDHDLGYSFLCADQLSASLLCCVIEATLPEPSVQSQWLTLHSRRERSWAQDMKSEQF